MLLTVRNVTIGEGRPKIVVPVTGEDETRILQNARIAFASPADIIEWRADTYADWQNDLSVLSVLSKLRNAVGDKVLLFTFRTKDEGGSIAPKDKEYIHLMKLVTETGNADMLDIECCVSEYRATEIMPYAKQKGIFILGTAQTVTKLSDADMENRIRYMQCLGADTVKITVFPGRKSSVYKLLNMIYSLSTDLDIPITIEGGDEPGKYTKALAEFYGNSLVWGSIEPDHGPEEISVYRLAEILNCLHEL